MAALCTGTSYGLSNLRANDNKELIFVKLTDSAFRAIEEYNRNKDKLNSSASIKFYGNEGVLLFPTLANNDRKFNFQITEFEGSQGSFELIQQSTQNGRLLETLGAMPNKMLIQANDDVYEATKHRMAVAEEIKKDKCTREIKPNQTDIWRRGKSKTSSSSSSGSSLSNRLVGSSNSSSSSNTNIPNSVGAASLASAAAPYSSSINGHSINGGGSSSSSNNVNNLNSVNSGKQRDSYLSSNSSAAATTTTVNGNGVTSSSAVSGSVNSSLGSHGITNNGQDSVSRLSNGGGLSAGSGTVSGGGRLSNSGSHRGGANGYNGSGGGGGGGGGQNGGGSRGNPDIMKRSLKERLIHLLAVRPYKKPELYAKIKSEGIKEREKTQITNVLKSISYLRDNTYHLNRHIWNDVQEDWPFYTEQDRACLKRRKPQNLTPPLSSDGGSSTSGQSPKSTHSSVGGSPSQQGKRGLLPGDEKYMDGPNAKKPRISHFVKSETSPKISPTNHESEDSGMSLSFSVIRPESNGSSSSSSSSSSSGSGKRTSPTFSQKYHQSGGEANGGAGGYKNGGSGNKLGSSNNHNSHKEINGNGEFNHNGNGTNNKLYRDNNGNSNGRSSMDYNNGHGRNGSSGGGGGYKKSGGYRNGDSNGAEVGGRGSGMDSENGHHHNRYQLDISSKLNNGTPEHDFSEFSSIQSIDQRREYKSIFEKDYKEYKKLHEEIDRVSKRFAQLEENLRMEERSRKDSSKVKEIQRQIVHEYKSKVQDSRHQSNKERFQYLHEKLSVIKRLVSDFDLTITKGNRMQAQTSY